MMFSLTLDLKTLTYKIYPDMVANGAICIWI